MTFGTKCRLTADRFFDDFRWWWRWKEMAFRSSPAPTNYRARRSASRYQWLETALNVNQKIYFNWIQFVKNPLPVVWIHSWRMVVFWKLSLNWNTCFFPLLTTKQGLVEFTLMSFVSSGISTTVASSSWREWIVIVTSSLRNMLEAVKFNQMIWWNVFPRNNHTRAAYHSNGRQVNTYFESDQNIWSLPWQEYPNLDPE